MSLATTKKRLRQLPFLEMTSLATEVKTALSTSLDPQQIAAALATLPVEPDEDIQADQKILAKFLTRKRAITIRPADGSGSWDIEVQGGPTVRCTNIRDGMSEFLETLVAYKALEK